MNPLGLLAARYLLPALVLVLSLAFIPTAGAGTPTLRLGDELQIRGTHFYCDIQRDSAGTGVACIYGSAINKPKPNSYGPFVTTHYAGILRYKSITSAQSAALRAEPTIRPGVFRMAKKRKPQLWTLQVGDRATIGGTDLVCVVIHLSRGTPRGTGLGCRPSDAQFNSIPGTWGFLLIGDTASIARYRDKNDNPGTTITKLQP